MTKSEDCPSKTNNEIRAEFVDTAVADRLMQGTNIANTLRLAAEWKSKLPKIEAANAERLHTRNRNALREAGGIIDAHRSGEGRAEYNEKQRKIYAQEKGAAPREYLTGLPPEERATRLAAQNAKAQAKVRAGQTKEEQSAARADRRRRAKERAKAVSDAALAARSIF